LLGATSCHASSLCIDLSSCDACPCVCSSRLFAATAAQLPPFVLQPVSRLLLLVPHKPCAACGARAACAATLLLQFVASYGPRSPVIVPCCLHPHKPCAACAARAAEAATLPPAIVVSLRSSQPGHRTPVAYTLASLVLLVLFVRFVLLAPLVLLLPPCCCADCFV
jgi:hypothetical protein